MPITSQTGQPYKVGASPILSPTLCHKFHTYSKNGLEKSHKILERPKEDAPLEEPGVAAGAPAVDRQHALRDGPLELRVHPHLPRGVGHASLLAN